MKVGIDIVKISRLANVLRDRNQASRIFNNSEMTDNTETLAGIFAAKEAYFKAKGKKGDWLDLEIAKLDSGQPIIKVNGKNNGKISLSISHETDYAVAVVIIESN